MNKGVSDFPVLRQCFDGHIELGVNEGVSPYEYANSLDRLKGTSLPAREYFDNKLTELWISDVVYAHAQSV